MKQVRRQTDSFPWLKGLRWTFAGYVGGTLAAAGAQAMEAGLPARGALVLAAVCFVASLVCAVMSVRKSRAALFYLLLAAVMVVVAVLFGSSGG